MTNLFSTFDPSTHAMMSFNWLSTLIIIVIMPNMYWNMPNRIMITIVTIYKHLNMEFKTLTNSKNMTLPTISLFFFIFINNMTGLLPYTFTSTSHLVFTMSMALPLWLSMIMFGWLNKTNYMLAHLIPLGTPIILMPFMVLIETISNIIRPSSLAVRLMANMIAGHLLMSLLGNNSINNIMMLPIILTIQIILMMFESTISIIQAYVFSVLSTLYSSEVIYEK